MPDRDLRTPLPDCRISIREIERNPEKVHNRQSKIENLISKPTKLSSIHKFQLYTLSIRNQRTDTYSQRNNRTHSVCGAKHRLKTDSFD